MSVKINGLRTKARVFAPDAFDPGQVVVFAGRSGVVWSLGGEVGRSYDTRWVVLEDGSVNLLTLDKSGSGKDQQLVPFSWTDWRSYVPANAVPFSVAEFTDGSDQMEMAA